ncbi:MAG: hypothetical protein ACPGN3_14585 [Opitutales bacterium]
MRLPCLPLSIVLQCVLLSSAGAAIEIKLARGEIDAPETEFYFGDLDYSEADVRGGPMYAEVAESVLKRVKGSFKMKWIAKGNYENVDPSAWDFGNNQATLISRDIGWGIQTENEGEMRPRIRPQETLLFEFDFSKLVIVPGYLLTFQLVVDSDLDNHFKLFQRVGAKEGVEAKILKSGKHNPKSVGPVAITRGRPEFAFGRHREGRGKAFIVDSFVIDVVPESVFEAK